MDDPVYTSLRLERRSRDRANEVADAIGTSLSDLVQWSVDRLELDADGVPVGWWTDHRRPGSDGQQGQFDIDDVKEGERPAA